MKRRMSRVKRVRRKTTWIIGSWMSCATPLTISRCDSEVSDPDVFSIVVNPATSAALGLADDIGEVTLLRTVGEFHLGYTVLPAAGKSGVATIAFAECMYIADTTLAGSTVIDPVSPDDMVSKDIIWMRTVMQHFNYAGAICSGSEMSRGDPAWSHIDVRVKRKIRANEAILYAVTCILDGDALPAGCQTVGSPLAVTEVFPYAMSSVRALVALP